MEQLVTAVMDWIKPIFAYIFLPYLLTFVLLTYGLKESVCSLLDRLFFKGKPTTPSKHWVVFIIATFTAIPFMVIPSWRPDMYLKRVNEVTGATEVYNMYALRLFVTYCFGTVLYDLIIYRIIKAIKGKDAT